MTTILVALLVLWVLFNLLAGYAPLLLAERISPGRLPAELLRLGTAKRVRFYVGNNVKSYAYSLWAPPYTVVVFDRRFFLRAEPDLVRFVVAHELGHAHAHHHIIRWLSIVTGAVLLPVVRRVLLRHELDADSYAMELTGLTKSMFPQLLQ